MTPARYGVIVPPPVIAPYRAARHEVCAAHAAAGTGYPEVWGGPPPEGCVRRDVKGPHAKADAGRIAGQRE